MKKALRLLPLVLLAIVVWRTKPWQIDVRHVRVWGVLAAIALNLAVYAPVRALRWRCALRSPPPFFQILWAMLEGFAFGTAVGFGSGDAVRAARLRRGSFAQDFGATMAERGAEVVALAIMLLCAAAAGLTGWWAAALGGGMVVGYTVTLLFGNRFAPRLRRWPRVEAGISGMLVASTPARIAAIAGLTLAGWAVEGAMLVCMLATFGLRNDPGTALTVLVGINLAIAVPGPPMNVGTFEAGIIAALVTRGIAAPAAVVFALVYHATITLPITAAGGVIYAIREWAEGRRPPAPPAAPPTG